MSVFPQDIRKHFQLIKTREPRWQSYWHFFLPARWSWSSLRFGSGGFLLQCKSWPYRLQGHVTGNDAFRLPTTCTRLLPPSMRILPTGSFPEERNWRASLLLVFSNNLRMLVCVVNKLLFWKHICISLENVPASLAWKEPLQSKKHQPYMNA